MNRMLARLVIVVALFVVSACGGSMAPSDAVITGTWGGPNAGYLLTLTLAQTGSNLTGTFRSSSGFAAQLSGSKLGNSVSLTLSPSVPTQCPYSYSATLSTQTSMSGTYASFNCTVADSGTLSLTKQ